MSSKLIDTVKLKKLCDSLKVKKKKIVLVSGVYDLVHLGHIKYFKTSKALGDVLILSLTTDKFVNKGIGKPVFNQYQRSEVLESISYIDYIVFSNNYSCSEVIKIVKPNIYSKGPDYKNLKKDRSKNIILEKKLVEKYGGKIHFVQEETFSSSNLISDNLSVYNNEQKYFLNIIKKKYPFEKILMYLEVLKKLNVACVGEAIIDRYIYCEPLGKSGKDSHLVSKYLYKEDYIGGSLAIARQLSEFCKKVDLFCMAGDNKKIQKYILKNLNKKINTHFVSKVNTPTIIKERFIDNISKNKIFGSYHLNEKTFNSLEDKIFQKKISKILKGKKIPLIISDYGHGFISKKMSKFFTQTYKNIFLNTQLNASNLNTHTISKYKSIKCLVINERELRYELKDNQTDDVVLGRKLMKLRNIESLVVTKGSSGSLLLGKNEKILCPAFSKNAVDKVGSGDTMLSLISLCIYSGLPKDLSLFLGNVIGALSVQIIGNKRSVKFEELVRTIQYLIK